MYKRLKLCLFLYRLCNALLCQTFFQPDEYFQSLEPAHHFVFGYGWQTWEWRAASGAIRSPLQFMPYVPAYYFVKLVGMEDSRLLVWTPQVVQAIIAASVDYYTFRLASQKGRASAANTALLCSLVSVANGYITIRAFSNSLETALTAAALVAWPWPVIKSGQVHIGNSGLLQTLYTLWLPLLLSALTCIIRPANGVLWLCLANCLLWNSKNRFAVLSLFGVAGSLAIVTCFAVDSWYYQTWTLTPYNFLKQNVWDSISVFYGSMPWHYYLSQGLPIMTFNLLPYLILVFRKDSRSPQDTQLLGSCAIVTLAYTMLQHKEMRFILPLVPIINVFAGRGLDRALSRHGSKYMNRHILFLLLTSILPLYYVLRVHDTGKIQVMLYLRAIPQDQLRSVAFLMPCHSTPWQSHLHRPDLEEPAYGGTGEGGRLWALTCEPPLGQNATIYKDQTTVFYDDPVKYLQNRFPAEVDPRFPPSPLPVAIRYNSTDWKHTWPSHIVVFEDLLNTASSTGSILGVLQKHQYHQVHSFWNSHFQDDDRRRGRIVVFEWKSDK